MKRFFCITLIITLLTAFVFAIQIPNRVAYAETQTKGYYLYEPTTKTVIESKNEKQRYPIASMVKIMTLLLTFEQIQQGNLKIDEQIVVSRNAKNMGGSQMFLDEGLSYSVDDLLLGIIIASANDACVCLAERIAGDEQSFVKIMNQRAKQLGMINTNFDNCTGLPSANGYSSCEDVATMFSEMLKHKLYFKYSKQWLVHFKHPDGRVTDLTNTNKLTRFFEGADGGKTGYTHEAGYCLAATALKKDLRVIAICIGATTSKERNAFISSLFNKAFSCYSSQIFAKSGDNLGKAQVLGGKVPFVDYTVDQDVTKVDKIGESSDYKMVYDVQALNAPIEKGQIIGKAYLTTEGKVIKEYPLIALHDVSKASYWDSFYKVLINW